MMKFFNIVVLVTLLFPMSVYGESTSGTNIQEDQALKTSGELSPEERFTITQKKAESGDAEAQLNLGTMYANGNGVPKDIAKALKLYRKAAGQGHAIAQFNLGAVYLTGNGTRKDTAKALEWFHKAAAQQDAPAQYNLGWMYEHGSGAPKNDVIAMEWYKKAADQGMEKAQYDLDRLNREVLTSKKLTPEVIARVQKEAEGGDTDAQVSLAVMYINGKVVPKDDMMAVNWLQKAVAQGDEHAQWLLGSMYQFGQGVLYDNIRAFALLELAASQGYASASSARDALGKKLTDNELMEGRRLASNWKKGDTFEIMPEEFQKRAKKALAKGQAELGIAYFYGLGGAAKDKVKAIQLMQESADSGNVIAQNFLGMVYSSGDGIAKNTPKAKEWFQKAADQEFAIAQYHLGDIYNYGSGAPKNDVIAMEWYLKAAAQGHVDAQTRLGVKYFNGDGISKDVVRGYAWINLAAAQDNIDAQAIRKDFELLITDIDRAEGQRLASNWKKGDTLLASNSNYFDKYDEVPPNNKPNKQGASTDQWAELDSYNIKESKLSKQQTGTAFIVSNENHAVTNHHVISGCVEVKVAGREGIAKVITSDSVNDLALLQLLGKSKDVAKLNPGIDKLKQGEDVIVFGYPLSSVLSSGGNLTPGTLSALTGLGNNTNQIQISAPIQPGSSGSPVMDKKGNVVAVVSMKLDDGKMAKATGQIGQNVNFAVNGQTIKSFLELNKVPYKTGGGFFSMEKSKASIAEEAHKWTVLVECWK